MEDRLRFPYYHFRTACASFFFFENQKICTLDKPSLFLIVGKFESLFCSQRVLKNEFCYKSIHLHIFICRGKGPLSLSRGLLYICHDFWYQNQWFTAMENRNVKKFTQKWSIFTRFLVSLFPVKKSRLWVYLIFLQNTSDILSFGPKLRILFKWKIKGHRQGK